MAFPSLRHPHRTAPADCGSMRVTLSDMIRAHRGTADFLSVQRGASLPLPPPSPTAAVGANAETPHRAARSTPAPGLGGGKPRVTPPRALSRIVGCPNCGEHFTPKAKKTPTRRPPDDAVVLTYLTARGGTAKLRDLARRFHLDAAGVDALVQRLRDARLGMVYQRPCSRRFPTRQARCFTLLRTATTQAEPPL
jgi:hypothetical protein